MLEDQRIVQLYWARSEDAIPETDKKYGKFCASIAKNILRNDADAEECVNDTYLRTWDSIPPQRPSILSAFLGKIVRNVSLDRYRYQHAQKRYAEMDALLSELEDCLPSPASTEAEVEAREVAAEINAFLGGLSRQRRIVFVQRYWYGRSVREIAGALGISEGQVKSTLFRLRNALRERLEKGGVPV